MVSSNSNNILDVNSPKPAVPFIKMIHYLQPFLKRLSPCVAFVVRRVTKLLIVGIIQTIKTSHVLLVFKNAMNNLEHLIHHVLKLEVVANNLRIIELHFLSNFRLILRLAPSLFLFSRMYLMLTLATLHSPDLSRPLYDGRECHPRYLQ
jgi:hypothetical protein